MDAGTPPLQKDLSSARGGTSTDEFQTSRGVTTGGRWFVATAPNSGGARSQASGPPPGSQVHLRTASIDTTGIARRSSDREERLQPWDREPNMGGFPTPEYAAEEHLWYVFAALSSRNVKLANEMDVSFQNEMTKPVIRHSMVTPFTADTYGERLRLRVKDMSIETLEAYHLFASKFPDKENPLVERVGLALNAEIQRREDAHTEALVRLTSADAHMKETLDALCSKDVLRAAGAVEKFVDVLKPINDSTANRDGAAFDMYKDRLEKRLSRMPDDQVEALKEGAENYRATVADPVGEGILAAAEEQLQQRQRTRASLRSLTDGQSS